MEGEEVNRHVITRLEAIQRILNAYNAGGVDMPNAMAGDEREHFIYHYLSQIFPPVYRFGRGSITDVYGNLSGQVDA
jgi:hypothetical protein